MTMTWATGMDCPPEEGVEMEGWKRAVGSGSSGEAEEVADLLGSSFWIMLTHDCLPHPK